MDQDRSEITEQVVKISTKAAVEQSG